MSAPEKAPRILACVLCQQRKIKCNRKFPCANCVKSGANCIPSTLAPRQRRRRFPERELLERLRRYEGLLRQNNIDFEPLHPASSSVEPQDDGQSESPSGDKTVADESPEPLYEAQDLWYAMNQKSRDAQDDEEASDSDGALRETVVKTALGQMYPTGDHLLLGSREINVDVSSLHPEQVHIFRLWQIYLENINPLLKVTHTPSLQTRIIDAASNVKKINPTLEALMFSIYCVSLISVADEDCAALFGVPKEELLPGFQFGCQQALMNCGYLKSSDRDCLTALYLYMVSARKETDPRSVAAMNGVTIRIAQRMGIHLESTHVKSTPHEAEMCRRLWWSIVLFDNRVCEMSEYKATMLTPAWDCKVPMNINDFDFQSEMKLAPSTQQQPSEAIFAVVRSEVGEIIRHSAFHLDFTNPSFKLLAKEAQFNAGRNRQGVDLVALQQRIEDRYLRFCNPENPLHFMTIWATRGYFAKHRLMDHYRKHLRSVVEQTEDERDSAVLHAVNVLECDTKLVTSPLTKGFVWFTNFHFPFPPYIHLVQDLRKRPIQKHTEKAWEVMNANYMARFSKQDSGPFFTVFYKNILHGWKTYTEAISHLDQKVQVPSMVSDLLERQAAKSEPSDVDQASSNFGMNTDMFSMSTPMNFGGLTYGMGGQDPLGMESFSNSNLSSMDVDVNDLDWSTIDLNKMQWPNW